MTVRTLVLVLGDQLSHDSPALVDLDPQQDAVLMIEAPGEATHVWSHKARIALFLAAMRHFRDELRATGLTVHYVALGDNSDSELPTLAQRLAKQLQRHRPALLRMLEAGEWRLQQDIAQVAQAASVPLRTLDDTHFLCSRADFMRWAAKYSKAPGSSLRMEFFYREMRRTHRVLLDADGQPEGGQWNYDADNRKGYPKAGPGLITPPEFFEPDALTREVFADVEQRFADHPGTLAHFAWPVNRAQALVALKTFVETRLANFGDHQDAMWTATPFGWHSLLSTSLNLHLLDPREVIKAAEAAYRAGRAPLAGVEGFIRQVLGWREFIRGVYWLDMPGMAQANHLQHTRPLPRWYWTGQTQMACAREAVEQTLKYGYAHHIQRLMVTGLFALLAETDPKQVADWYLAVYVDAVEWAELPNVAGMALYANGGRFTSKPYVASGAYIQRMSNHCDRCAYAPTAKDAAKAGKPTCPFTVLYWNFLLKHEAELAGNPRTALMAKNAGRLGAEEREAVSAEAQSVLGRLDEL
ncbi:MAG: deoxyribodipyrimidine photolyase [Methylibium sp. NZG]|nr:MAG: deoxyribodipyrimidine photolyase [Methylibium sp. NZG]